MRYGTRRMQGMLVLLMLLAASTASAQLYASGGPDTEQLLDASLEDLLNAVITVTSKKAERASDAPGIVTTYQEEEIRRFGYYTIAELANLTSGYSATRTPETNRGLETRGSIASLNEKHLVLLDGMPINHARNNTALVQEELPLLFARSVEYLRGPASSLYGVGAFNGVVSITPRSPTRDGAEVEALATLGLDNWGDNFYREGSTRSTPFARNRSGALALNRRLLAHGMYRTEYSDFVVSAGYQGNEARLQTTGEESQNLYRDQQDARFLYVSERVRKGWFEGFGIGFLHMARENGYGASWAGDSNVANRHLYESTIPYLRLRRDLSDTVRFNAYTKMQLAREAGHQANDAGWWADAGRVGTFGYDVYTSELEGLSELSWSAYQGNGFLESVDLITGLTYQVRWQMPSKSWTLDSNSDGPVRLFDGKSHTYSAYSQLGMRADVLAGLLFTAGARLDYGTLAGRDYVNISPRVSLVQKLDDTYSIKAMYGTALKAPGIDAYSHNLEKQPLLDAYNAANADTLSISDIGPEHLQTMEAAINAAFGRFTVTLSGFYNQVDDEIARIAAFDAIDTDFFLNLSGTTTTAGGELEVTARPTDDLNIRANGSYARGRTADDQRIEGAPRAKFNGVLDYTIRQAGGLNAVLVSHVVSGYNPNRLGDPSYKVPDSSLGPTFSLDANLRYPLLDRFWVGAQVLRLIATQRYAPDGLTPMLPRSVLLTLSLVP